MEKVAASDDAAMVAVMLEVMRSVAHRGTLQNALIFNFNGAEETNWQAAHGFITQHPWASSLRALINLEATGAGKNPSLMSLVWHSRL